MAHRPGRWAKQLEFMHVYDLILCDPLDPLWLTFRGSPQPGFLIISSSRARSLSATTNIPPLDRKPIFFVRAHRDSLLMSVGAKRFLGVLLLAADNAEPGEASEHSTHPVMNNAYSLHLLFSINQSEKLMRFAELFHTLPLRPLHYIDFHPSG